MIADIDEEVEKWCLNLLEKVTTCLKVVNASFNEEIEMMPHHTIDYLVFSQG